ncbi:MAG: apolipoprotein N-acyltransferase [Bacteroidota bacterium]|nr:apolipoprotein N-acyltransferase [Bacteroidota bacterium]MDP3144193.1 apolipoprotein N-acyltransferase [Bacteroidota bacterium]
MQKKVNYLLLSFSSAILLSAGWLLHLSLFIFFAFVPLLQLEDDISKRFDLPKRKLKLFAYTYLTFFIWNILTTWWVSLASFGGACVAFVFNSLFMSIVFLIFSNLKNKINKPFAIWMLIPLWLGYEFLHTVWDLSWSWLILGNVFAFNTNWIQWFEFTGTSGGTLWVLFVNILIFSVLKNNATLKIISKPILKIAASVIVPILFSYLIFVTRKPLSNPNDKLKIIVVQPNIDPYNDKFVMDFEKQFEKFLNLVRGKVTNQTDYIILPETFIIGQGLNEDILNENEAIQIFRDSLISKFPKLKIVVGADTYRFFTDKNTISATARPYQDAGVYYDSYNTAMQIDADSVQIYHKSKLVPGVERMPFPALLKPLEGLAIEMGGTFGSLGIQAERAVLTDTYTSTNIAPIVCYESVYSDYVTEYVRKNANVIFIITNDGWWGNSPGHVQHLNYARLRAIENRLQIARSANTGISCFINEFGEISNATNYWEEAIIEKDIYKNNKHTLYSMFGDLIAYSSVVLSIFLMLLAILLKFKK